MKAKLQTIAIALLTGAVVLKAKLDRSGHCMDEQNNLKYMLKRLERKIDIMRADFLSQNNHRKHDTDEMMLLLYKIKEELGLNE